MNRQVALMYHDVVEPGHPESSGFRSGDANIYKVSTGRFTEHLAAIQARIGNRAPVLFTFDDGGVSFHHPIADLLEERNWRGYFFISTDFIGSAGFLTTQQIRELLSRGHVIGSHSCSHPIRMSACSREQLRREWNDSIKRLADITGTAITTASVPGGHFSRTVAETAAEAGLELLFTSEPTISVSTINGCRILGRYAVYASTTAEECAALAAGAVLPRWKQSVAWTGKKALKKSLGPAYLKIRAYLLNRGRSRGVHA